MSSSQPRREYRGKWAGYSAERVARLMNCHVLTAKKYLYQLRDQLGGECYVTEKDIGWLIHKYWELQDLKIIKSIARGRK